MLNITNFKTGKIKLDLFWSSLLDLLVYDPRIIFVYKFSSNW